MPINISVPETTELQPRITVIGVGGAGGNAVNNMIESALEGVEFVVANTDAQAVGLSKATKKIQLGVNTTQGLGAGSMPNVGSAAAEESLEEIMDHVGNSHMLFVTAGMGGGTGTGAAPVIAQAAKERDILTVGVVTKPFHFEGARRMRVAMAGIEELQKHVDTLLIIPNQNLFSIADERTTFHEAFSMADEVLHSGVRGITDLMVMPGLINLDFADVRTVMGEMGQAMMGTGEAEGEKRAIEAAEAAISNPLLDKVSMKGARGVLINITGSMDMKLFEIDEAANRIRAEVDPDANIIIGSTFNQELEGKVRVSVVATGIDVERSQEGDDTSARPRDGGSAPLAATTVAPGKPWRQTPQQAPQQVAQSTRPAIGASVPLTTGVGATASHQTAAVRTQMAPNADPVSAVEPAAQPVAPTGMSVMPAAEKNPVGDVQARIRRLLTEGDTSAGTIALPTPEPTEPAVAPTDNGQQGTRNPFRGVARQSFGAAVGAIKNLGAGSEAAKPTASPNQQSGAAKSGNFASGDLFDDDPDAELEIPAFLRKKKIG
ncbi:MAG: cell division protein FtsZ [Pseudomonadota bacterium]